MTQHLTAGIRHGRYRPGAAGRVTCPRHGAAAAALRGSRDLQDVGR